jgi:hypothetical protein
MKNELPEAGRVITAEVEHCTGGHKSAAELIAVDETDCSWRFADDNSELAYDWDVISWEYKK